MSSGNKQPFYHQFSVLFTATTPLDSESEIFLETIKKSLAKKFGKDIIINSIEYEDVLNSEPGNPEDLME